MYGANDELKRSSETENNMFDILKECQRNTSHYMKKQQAEVQKQILRITDLTD